MSTVNVVYYTYNEINNLSYNEDGSSNAPIKETLFNGVNYSATVYLLTKLLFISIGYKSRYTNGVKIILLDEKQSLTNNAEDGYLPFYYYPKSRRLYDHKEYEFTFIQDGSIDCFWEIAEENVNIVSSGHETDTIQNQQEICEDAIEVAENQVMVLTSADQEAQISHADLVSQILAELNNEAQAVDEPLTDVEYEKENNDTSEENNLQINIKKFTNRY